MMKRSQISSDAAWTTSFLRSSTNDEVALRVFGKKPRPASAPIIVYFHGGLFNCGTVADADSIARALADHAVVVCVDYPLAPKCHFPDSVEVAFEALQWVWGHAAELGGHAARVIVAGDQAGGNLAAAVAMVARDRAASAASGAALKGQILITPMLDPQQTTLSMRAAPDCPCQQAWADYLPSASDAMHPYAAPLHSRRLGGLASTLIITAELDPLRDEAELYAARLITAGVPVQVRRFEAVGGYLVTPSHACFAAVAETMAQFISDSFQKSVDSVASTSSPSKDLP
ncbi:alpha/beta hydrolase [Paraherbaspirillum soli]|uniref:Alpha/beta hydrolase n=1 Tax=Paraherbaspirillum soli TaxID=631222 RepID=A0ABW0M956_9BURK